MRSKNRSRFLVLAGLTVAVALAATGQAMAQTLTSKNFAGKKPAKPVIVVTAATAEIKAGTRVVARANRGQRYRVLKTSGNWYMVGFTVNCTRRRGWIYRDNVGVETSQTPASKKLGSLYGMREGLASATDWADLSGKFVYDGKAPAPKLLLIKQDAKVFGKLGLVDESLVVDKKSGGVANIVIYVRTRNVDIHPDYAKNVKECVRLDFKGARFVPRILPLWVGKQEMCVSHALNLQPIGDKGFSPLILPKGEFTHKFNREQIIPVPIFCPLHPWMRGYVLPRSNPYVAVTSKDGSFKLSKLPAGKILEIQVWHEKSGYVVANGWTRGRFKIKLEPNEHKNLGTIKLQPTLFKY